MQGEEWRGGRGGLPGKKVGIKIKKTSRKWRKEENWWRSRGGLQIFTVRFSEWVKVPSAAEDVF